MFKLQGGLKIKACDVSVLVMNMASLQIFLNVNLRYCQHEGLKRICVTRMGTSRLFFFVF